MDRVYVSESGSRATAHDVVRGRGCGLRGVWVDRVVAEPGTFADEGVQGKKETRNAFRSQTSSRWSPSGRVVGYPEGIRRGDGELSGYRTRASSRSIGTSCGELYWKCSTSPHV